MIILAGFIFIKAFWQIEHTYCYVNCIYKRIPSNNIPAFEIQGVTTKINMRFYEARKLEENWIEEDNMQCIDYEMTKAIKTSNV